MAQANCVIAQLRTTNLDQSIEFYTNRLGFSLDFRYEDFYAGIRVADNQSFHLKLVDEKDPSIHFAQAGEHIHLFLFVDDVEAFARERRTEGVQFYKDLHSTPWGTREFYVLDDQGHVLCFAEGVGDEEN